MRGEPLKPEIADRKTRFEALNNFVRSRNGWLTSVPGAPEVTMECLPGSLRPDDLRKLGYVVEKIGESQRILPHAVAQRFEVSSSGALIPATEGSTKPVTVQVTHAGIATVEQYDLRRS
jgi:hypothetical protein